MVREAAKTVDEPQPKDKTEMARFVRLLEELGPDVNQIARRMNVYKETARYWYRKKVVGKGYSILGSAAHLKLGLRRLIIIARVEPAYREHVQNLFVDMDGLWYVVGFSRTMPDDVLVIHASVPDGLVDNFIAFMNDLKTKVGFFIELEFLPSDWIYRVPMRAEYHNFDRGQWEFDWNMVSTAQAKETAPRQQAKVEFDGDDLLLVRELQVNAARPLSKIAEELNMPYKKALRHYKHVTERGLISGYRLVWTRTRYLSDERKLVTRKHSYMFCSLIVKDVREVELSKLVAGVEKVPFLWAICGGRNFLAEFFFPLDVVNEALNYLREMLTPYAGRMMFFVTDWDDTLTFSIPIEMYDRQQKRWVFDQEKTLGEFEANLDALVEKSRSKPQSADTLAPSQRVPDSPKRSEDPSAP